MQMEHPFLELQKSWGWTCSSSVGLFLCWRYCIQLKFLAKKKKNHFFLAHPSINHLWQWLHLHWWQHTIFGGIAPPSTWGLSSSTRDRIHTPKWEAWSLNHRTAREVPVNWLLIGDSFINQKVSLIIFCDLKDMSGTTGLVRMLRTLSLLLRSFYSR